MGEQSNELGGTLPIPTYLVVGVLLTVFGGGAGLNSLLGPRIETQALEQCSNNAEIALGVTAQHGEEFVEVYRRMRELKEYIEERTQNRYTSEDAYVYKARQKDYDAAQDRHLQDHDRRLDRLERNDREPQ